MSNVSIPDLLLSPQGVTANGGGQGNQYNLHLTTNNDASRESIEGNFRTMQALGV
jgi:hypothetical protein